ncbi:molybdenum cofactor guanylyltransferase [Myxococcus sp. CA056]|uniref:molybdenum cofactor guanylyltransferase n=1 Tax=unclassified Myxococcus TaxID=2648731 RepID=UPI00157AB6B8|nr:MULTISPECIES: molybdenum cofactor guanylyltransferase [unclassified Myxococcus]NTX10651.1 molybdenum cofactor guanylyltransferase [Myxococcus sp. CA056]NTX40740.1 molybdenum cofactor guanylyltransferase [Myxococcus sp. CA033]
MDPNSGSLGNTYPDVTLAIIAGGQGRRLSGVPKGMLEVEGRTVLARLLALAPRFGEVLLVANAPEPYARYALRTVADVVPDKGAPGGVHAALSAARTPWVVAVACDMPFISPDVLRVLLDARGDDVDAVCFDAGGRVEPLLAVYRAALARVWRATLSEDPSLRQLLSRFRARLLPESALRAVDPSLRALVNVNTPQDLTRYAVTLPGE